jgi:hypothetical protein
MHSSAIQFLPALREAAEKHFWLCLELYPQCRRPKLHFIWHNIETMEDDEMNMSRDEGTH